MSQARGDNSLLFLIQRGWWSSPPPSCDNPEEHVSLHIYHDCNECLFVLVLSSPVPQCCLYILDIRTRFVEARRRERGYVQIYPAHCCPMGAGVTKATARYMKRKLRKRLPTALFSRSVLLYGFIVTRVFYFLFAGGLR